MACCWSGIFSKRQDSAGNDEPSIAQLKAELAIARHALRRKPLYFKVGQYNILAGYLGRNTEPWFMYGIDMPEHRRSIILKKFHERNPDGKLANAGWPNYVQGILSAREIAEVERINRQRFVWEDRKHRLTKVIADLDCDILSIVECDHYEDHFRPALQSMGFESIWKQRPRPSSHDGCCVAWRRGAFQLLASQVVEFIDVFDPVSKAQVKDRIALLCLLQSSITEDNICFVSTHLARNPEQPEKDGLRSRQIGQVMKALSEFVTQHDAHDAPVVVAGDLNAFRFSRLLGVASTTALLRGEASVHPFVFCCKDVPSPCTSVTTSRQMRIDAILYQGDRLQVVNAPPYPQLCTTNPMPNEYHPSDHLPIAATFRILSRVQVVEAAAREWFYRIAEYGRYRFVSPDDLRHAFALYDHQCLGKIGASEIRSTVASLLGYSVTCPNSFMRKVNEVIDKLPAEGIDLVGFIEMYKKAVGSMGPPGLSELDDSFEFFDVDGNGTLDYQELVAMISQCSPTDVSSEELHALFAAIDADLDGNVSMPEFKAHLANVWNEKFLTWSKN